MQTKSDSNWQRCGIWQPWQNNLVGVVGVIQLIILSSHMNFYLNIYNIVNEPNDPNRPPPLFLLPFYNDGSHPKQLAQISAEGNENIDTKFSYLNLNILVPTQHYIYQKITIESIWRYGLYTTYIYSDKPESNLPWR